MRASPRFCWRWHWSLQLALAFALIALPVVSTAESLPIPAMTNWVIRSWGAADGLPQNTINSMVQTRDGYLWLGTREGLARFDGVRFKVFGLREGLESVAVSVLFQDSRGTLWIGTEGGGLGRLVNDRIEPVPTAQRGVAGDSVTSLTQDAQGRLWVGTRGGVNVLQDGRLIDMPALEPLQRANILSLLHDREGALWIATAVQGLFRYAAGQLSAIPPPPWLDRISSYCLLEDHTGSIWASIGNGNILCYTNGAWTYYSSDQGVPFAYVTSMLEEANGTIWAGSLDAGLYYLHEGKFRPIRREQGLSGDDIRSILQDREGNLWIGTRSAGVNRLTRPKLVTCGAGQGLTNDYTRGVAQTADGTLWVAATGGGLFHGTPEAMRPFGSGDSPARHYVTAEAVLATRDGALWWGASRALMRARDGVLEAVYTNLPALRSGIATALCEDPSGGLWIGTSAGGLLYHDKGAFTERRRRGLARGAVTALAVDSAGTLWVGSIAGGLRGIRPNGGEVLSITNGLLSQSIRTLHLDASGTLYIGTAGGGLAMLRNNRITSFTSDVGLSADTVSQIVEDDWGDLWLGCSTGILRVSKAELEAVANGKASFLHPRRYGINDGMPVEECSGGFSPAGLKTKNGLICFSTVKGLVFIDPLTPAGDASIQEVLLEEVLVAEQEVKPMRPKVSEDAELAPEGAGTMAPQVRIPPGKRGIQIRYSAINLASPTEVKFRYQLEGVDREWQEAGTRRIAFYNNVPPGDYDFRVIASAADSGWTEAATILRLTVQPQIWETRWFPWAVGFVGIGTLAAMLRVAERRRYRRRLATLETQHAVERERLRISQDMHDHIGAILTRVSLLSDLGRTANEASPPTSSQFERIGQQTRSAVQALDEIIWATNPKNDNLPRFVEYVSRYADEFFESSPIRCWQEVPGVLPNYPLKADVRHNVFLAIREAFNNVLKHSAASEVWLRIQIGQSEAHVEIEDNGKGFQPDQATGLGNGLANMESRLRESGGRAEILGTPGKGARLKFSFPIDAIENPA